ncbi:MAG TPA: Crp/Fnr family transcriptional regulator [Candidatus Blautia intestinipullorum]|nr:Crp/Fnr family transcriptional regulator [Candidatus Blautia intestinipullorum]
MFDLEGFWRTTVGIKDTGTLAALDNNSYIKNLEKGQRVIKEGETVTEVGFIVRGVLKAVYKDIFGKERVYCFGYIPGEAAVSVANLAVGVKSICSVEAVNECTILCVPMVCLVKLIHNNIEASHVYSRMLSMSLRKVIEHNKILMICEVQERYQWFRETYPGLSELVRKKDIASYLGMTPESLSRILKEVRKNIETKHGNTAASNL